MLVDNMARDNLTKPEEFSRLSASPGDFDLSRNFPNPGNPTTTICFRIPEASPVALRIFNILGHEVKALVDDHREAGAYTVVWDGKNNRGLEVPSGMYLYTLRAGEKMITKKLLLMK